MACNICELTLFKVTPQQTIVKTILIIVMFYSVLVPILKFLCSCPLKKKLTFMLKKQTLCKQERKITSSFPKSFLLSWCVRGKIACEQAFNTLALLTDSSLTTAPATTHKRACLQARGQQVGKTEKSYMYYLMCKLSIKWFANTALLISNKKFQFAKEKQEIMYYGVQFALLSCLKNEEKHGIANSLKNSSKWLKDMLSFF